MHCRLTISCALALIAYAAGCHAAPLTLARRSTIALPTQATDQFGQPFTITGLSAITYLDPTRCGAAEPAPDSDHRFIAVMDNSSKLIELSIRFDASGVITQCTLIRGLTLTTTHDWEGAAFTDPARNSIILSDEDRAALSEFRLTDGTLIRDIAPPSIYTQRRANLGLESLSSRERTDHYWLANEEALAIDGPISTPTSGTDVRLSLLNIAPTPISAPLLIKQVVYRTEPIHGAVVNGARSGLSGLVALPDGRLLALERSFGLASPLFLTRVYEVTTAATDVRLQTAGLTPGTFSRCGKSLIYSGGNNNLEGLCLGPRLAGPASTRWALVGIVDDGDPISINQVVSFQLDGLSTRRRELQVAPAH
ncbi:MAG: esterase-like activity of phytase family protein [Planctomycetes bacterium]|nr:esterase-like activity of phytase family protein [Planctomycetota bacterium]